MIYDLRFTILELKRSGTGVPPVCFKIFFGSDKTESNRRDACATKA